MDKEVLYRVALASTDNIHVDQHFGRSESFLIVDVDSEGNYEEVEQRFVTPVCMGGYHDENKLKMGVEALLDCNFVLVSRIGPGAADELRMHGIAAFEMPGEVPDSLKRLNGYLQLLKEMSS